MTELITYPDGSRAITTNCQLITLGNAPIEAIDISQVPEDQHPILQSDPSATLRFDDEGTAVAVEPPKPSEKPYRPKRQSP